jgi:hypothetical protein
MLASSCMEKSYVAVVVPFESPGKPSIDPLVDW